MNEQCALCGNNAAVRVRGTSFCASCGLNQYSADATVPSRRKHRGKIFAFLTSGVFVKGLLGAVALAAMGSVAAGAVVHHEHADPAAAEGTINRAVVTTMTAVADAAETVAAVKAATVPTTSAPVAGSDVAEAVVAYAAAVQAWADCVADASAQTGGKFDPDEACPGKPTPGDFGINLDNNSDEAGPGASASSAGHDAAGPGNSESAAGHDAGGPGNSENASGSNQTGNDHSEDAPGSDAGGPGSSENAPGHDRGGSIDT